MSRATHPQTPVLSIRSVKTAAVLLAAVTLPCIVGGVCASAVQAETQTPTAIATARSGGLSQAATSAVPPTSTDGTPPVPDQVPDAPARVRAKVTRFAISTSTWTAGTAAPKIDMRLDASRVTAARVQVRIEDRSNDRIVARQSFGVVRSGVNVQKRVTTALAKRAGSYRLRLIVRDATGHELRGRVRSLRVESASTPKSVPASAPAATPKAPAAGAGGYVFPVQGACNFRSLAAQRFHAGRDGGGRQHNGQDIGTFDGFPPVVAVTNATVASVGYDDAGGGWTIVFNGDDGIAYGYLHLKPGTILVSVGQRVTAGQQVANAGQSGGDYDPHLHFEMRPIPWDANRAKAVDPMPLLLKLPNSCEG